MQLLLGLALGLLQTETPEQAFLREAAQQHGDLGQRAAQFLLEHQPESDRGRLSLPFLLENLNLALAARAEFPWAAAVTEELFFNDVLPYAVFDEPRDPWRAELLTLARPIVAGAESASAAAQALNRELFNTLGLHYHTGRKRPNQSFAESRAQGKATCTGLSIVLVEACRSVGIPARAVGTPLWANGRGNHTWVEIWDGQWHFTGADEYDANGLNRGWFVGDAAQAKSEDPKHRIYASSWRRGDQTFPLVWSPESTVVAAVDVTQRYTQAADGNAGKAAESKEPVAAADQTGPNPIELGMRVTLAGERIVAQLVLLDQAERCLGRASTKAGRADLNDMPRFRLNANTAGRVLVEQAGAWRSTTFTASAEANQTLELAWEQLTPLSPPQSALEAWLATASADAADAPEAALSQAEAEYALRRLWDRRQRALAAELQPEFAAQTIQLGERQLRYKAREFGQNAPGQRSLWISMHGGGGAPPEVNDQQWENQIKLYEPAEGIYVAPRAPTDTWNLWHEGHIDPLFDRMIAAHVVLAGVDPERIYLLGYSAGGDGVWQLAPRCADRYAAAAMMAGHPNEAQLDGLLNLPFGLFMGADDGAYGRNRIATERAQQLAELSASHPGGYPHMARIYPGLGHWMKRQDAEALPWMAEFRRRSSPSRVIWLQDDVTHERFYWLAVPGGGAQAGQRVDARISGQGSNKQRIDIQSDNVKQLELRLNDALLDLDQPLEVFWGQKQVFAGRLERNAAELERSLRERADPSLASSARLSITAP